MASLPAWGLQPGEIGSLGAGNARVVADRVILEASPATVAQVRETLEGFRSRPSIILEVFVLDVGTNVVDRTNDDAGGDGLPGWLATTDAISRNILRSGSARKIARP